MDNQVREEIRTEEAKEIINKMNDEYQITKIYEMIKNNEIVFDFDNKKYRVRLLNNRDKDELDELRRKKFGRLIQDLDILTEKDLIKAYEARGIDINEMKEEMERIQKKILDANFKLGESLAKKDTELILNTYKEEVESLQNIFYELMIRKNHLMEFSLENQLENYVAKIIAYLSLDTDISDTEEPKWKRAFVNLDNFMEADEKLINLSATYSVALTYRM